MEKKQAETAKEEVKVPEAPQAVVKEYKTLEEAVARIKELEANVKPQVEVSQTPPVLTPEEYNKQKAQREKQMKYFKELSRGAKFIEFIIDDLNRGGFNRVQRRRIIKQLFNKQFSREFVQMYENKIDQILVHLDRLTEQLEKQAPAKPVDAAEIFEQNPDGSLKVKKDVGKNMTDEERKVAVEKAQAILNSKLGKAPCDCKDECQSPDACKKPEAPKTEVVEQKAEENK